MTLICKTHSVEGGGDANPKSGRGQWGSGCHSQTGCKKSARLALLPSTWEPQESGRLLVAMTVKSLDLAEGRAVLSAWFLDLEARSAL